MSSTIPFENFEDIHQEIPRAFSLMRLKHVTLAFIPRRLDCPGRPELSDFPRNILFANRVDIPKSGEIRLALYEPDFSTLEAKEGKKEMIYRNTPGGDSQVKIIKEPASYYSGVRTINGVDKSFSFGETWKIFFIHLGLPGLLKDEAFFSLSGEEILEAYPLKPISD